MCPKACRQVCLSRCDREGAGMGAGRWSGPARLWPRPTSAPVATVKVFWAKLQPVRSTNRCRATPGCRRRRGRGTATSCCAERCTQQGSGCTAWRRPRPAPLRPGRREALAGCLQSRPSHWVCHNQRPLMIYHLQLMRVGGLGKHVHTPCSTTLTSRARTHRLSGQQQRSPSAMLHVLQLCEQLSKRRRKLTNQLNSMLMIVVHC